MAISAGRKSQIVVVSVLLAAGAVTWRVLGRGPITATRALLFVGVALVLLLIVAIASRVRRGTRV